MADNWIAIIPRDLDEPANPKAIQEALEYFAQIAPEAEEVTIINGSEYRFFDSGSNLESITCCGCGTILDEDWWREQVDTAYSEDSESFTLNPITMPCCGKTFTLNHLTYYFDQGFSKWGIDAMNPAIGKIPASVVARFEEILSCRVRVVYQHL